METEINYSKILEIIEELRDRVKHLEKHYDRDILTNRIVALESRLDRYNYQVKQYGQVRGQI